MGAGAAAAARGGAAEGRGPTEHTVGYGRTASTSGATGLLLRPLGEDGLTTPGRSCFQSASHTLRRAPSRV